MGEVQKHSVHTLVFRSLKRSHDMFIADQSEPPPVDPAAHQLRIAIKARDEYAPVLSMADEVSTQQHADKLTPSTSISSGQELAVYKEPDTVRNDDAIRNTQLALAGQQQQSGIQTLAQRNKAAAAAMPKPQWHAPWKLYRVISGHTGWVRCIAFEPGNEWFCTGSNDRIIKIWDLASGKLKLSLTGHISGVRGLAVSPRQPYLFSCGEDKQVKCWDLEYNKVIRHYHGHLSGVYTLSLHPTIDVLITGGRDSTARVWDMRTKANIHTLSGHTNTVASVVSQATDPQVITGSHDSTIRLWDLMTGKTKCTLTHHKKSVRSLVIHPKINMFASGAPDHIKQWLCPEGKFIQNLTGHNAIVNCMAVNEDGVLVSGGDNGSMYFWDWRTGYNFQRHTCAVQPGSIDSEAGIFALCFDHSGTRLVTAEADKTIKIYREDDTATEESHPINFRPDILKRRRF